MSIITELSEVWTGRGSATARVLDDPVPNPLPYFEEAFQYVRTVINQTCKARNCTYAEMLEEVRKLDPDLVGKYFQLFDGVDCDVYGKWCLGALTSQDYQVFRRMVDDWRGVTFELIQALKGDSYGQ